MNIKSIGGTQCSFCPQQGCGTRLGFQETDRIQLMIGISYR